MPCQDKGLPSRDARGDRTLGERLEGASWSEQLDGKELRGAFGGERDDPFSGHRLPILLHLLLCGMLISYVLL